MVVLSSVLCVILVVSGVVLLRQGMFGGAGRGGLFVQPGIALALCAEGAACPPPRIVAGSLAVWHCVIEINRGPGIRNMILNM